MKIRSIFYVLAFILLVGSLVSAVSTGQNNLPGCRSLYWIDNENKSCGQKEFCGAFMYYGLQTFESKEQCLNAVEGFLCPDIVEMPPGLCPGKMVSGGKNSEGCDLPSKCVQNLSNGRQAEIKIMPETASERAIERLGELNFTIVLKEVGKGNETKVAYEVTAEKEGKMFGLFKIKGNVSIQVDAETGEVLKTHKPWWAFFATGI